MYFGAFDPTIIILIPAMIFAFYAQTKVSRAYNNYAKVGNRRGITGAQAARSILDANGLADIPIEITAGRLSDHYDPKKRVMRLSQQVYNDPSIASVAIAAHESGHAIQHGENYTPLKLRNLIAMPVSLISWLSWPLLIVGILIIQMGYYSQGNLIFNVGIFAFAGVVLFHAVTLPVEFNASKRAINLLVDQGIIYPEEAGGAKKVLSAAAMTYLAALAVAVANLIRLLLIRGRN
jgi:Zn-dependent membrane protease YugP